MRAGAGVANPIPAHALDAWDAPALAAVRKTLANGLRVILVENHTVPLVWMNWVSEAGFERDPRALTGLAALTPVLLREGTAHRSAAQITEEVDDLGAELIAGADWDAAFLNLELLSEDFAAGAELLVDMGCYAQFPEAALGRLRRKRLAELSLRRQHPRALADDEFARALYGATGYGRSPLGTPATLQRIEVADLAAFHQVHYRPACSYVVLVGSFDGEAAVDLLGSIEVPPPLVANPPPVPQVAPATEMPAEIRLVDVTTATQTELRVGHASVARNNDDLPALEVLNAILGRGPSSRLAASLRQREGLTYDVRSRFAARHQGGLFVVETSVSTEAAGAALAAIRREIERLCEELVPAAEVDHAKRGLFGAELQWLQSIRGTGVRIGPAVLDGDPAHHFERWRRAIAAVEPESLRELARRHIHPERLVAVAVGPVEALRSQFSSNGTHGGRLSRLESIS